MGNTLFQVGRILTKSEYADLMLWIKTNKKLRHRNGDTRGDGRVFCGYGYGYVNGEYWADRTTFDKRMDHCRKKMHEVRKSEGYKEAHREYCKKRYARSALVRFKSLQRSRKYQKKEDVKKYYREHARKWAKKNPDRVISNITARRERKLNRLHPSHSIEKESELRRQCRLLFKQTGIRHNVDHIIPLAEGGWHHHENMQVIPALENNRKRADPYYQSHVFKDFRSVPRELWPDHLVDYYLAMMTV